MFYDNWGGFVFGTNKESIVSSIGLGGTVYEDSGSGYVNNFLR
jgi:hypothetical protein